MKTYIRKVDEYIKTKPEFAQKILRKLREIIHKADPEAIEVIKWGAPYFDHKGPLCFIWGFTHHASFTLYNGALINDKYKAFNYGTENKKSRTIKYTDVSQIDEKVLIEYIKEAVRNNEAGIKVKIPVTKDKSVKLPKWLADLLKKEHLYEKYQKQIFTYRKGYLQWIEEAKQEETKQKRIGIMLKELRDGKFYMGMKR